MTTTGLRFPFPDAPEHKLDDILLTWWKALEDDKGERADLKRAEHPLHVAFSPAYHNLLYCLRDAGYRLSLHDRERLALVAGLAAHVKQLTDNGSSLATQMGSPKPGSDKAKPIVSELRFRQILATDDLGELYTQLRRAISLLDGTANLIDLARVFFHWHPIAEQKSYDPRKKWAYDYYAALPR